MTPGSEATASRPSARRRLAFAGLAAIVVVAGVTSVILWTDQRRSPIDRARELVTDDAGFDTGLEAGETLARVAQHLERAVAECRRDEGGRRCQAFASALGLSQVLAAQMLDCPAPGRFEARARMASYLDQVEGVARDAVRVPSPPELPRCGS